MKDNKGVTLIALVITIIVLVIVTGISITAGKTTIQKARLEELKTNMYLIQAKAREYVEEANFKIGNDKNDANKVNSVRQEVYTEKAQLGNQLTESDIPDELREEIYNIEKNPCYFLTEDAMKSWKLDKIEMEENEKYIIQFFENEEGVEIYNSIGYEGRHSLWHLEHYGSDEYYQEQRYLEHLG